jgi:uncharacterized membrane protein
MLSSKISNILSALLVLLFVYTGVSKLVDHHIFLSQLVRIPWRLLVSNASWFSYALPTLELLISMALIIPRLRQLGYWLSAVLLISFIIFLVIMLSQGLDLPCSCGGIIVYLTWRQHVIFNLVFTLISIWGILIERKHNIETMPENIAHA